MKTIKLKSLGLTGAEWIKRLEKKCKLSDYAKAILNSPDFKPAKKGTKYEITIVKVSDIGDKSYYTTKEIQKYASTKGYETTNAEVGCLLREVLRDKDIKALGVWYVTTFHTPIEAYGDPRFLGSDRFDEGDWLRTYWAGPDDDWSDHSAFAFGLPQVRTQSSEPENLPSDTQSLELRVSSIESDMEKIKKIINI